MPGMPEMSEQELMRETIQSGGISVPPGSIWLKEDAKKAKPGRGSLAELVNLTLVAQMVQASVWETQMPRMDEPGLRPASDGRRAF